MWINLIKWKILASGKKKVLLRCLSQRWEYYWRTLRTDAKTPSKTDEHMKNVASEVHSPHWKDPIRRMPALKSSFSGGKEVLKSLFPESLHNTSFCLEIISEHDTWNNHPRNIAVKVLLQKIGFSKERTYILISSIFWFFYKQKTCLIINFMSHLNNNPFCIFSSYRKRPVAVSVWITQQAVYEGHKANLGHHYL